MSTMADDNDLITKNIDHIGNKYSSCHRYGHDEVNYFTTQKLRELAEFSATIDEPKIVGKFNNEQHYLDTLKLVLNSTLETSNRILFFLNEIIPKLGSLDSLLDIGPGDGSLTKKMAGYFKKVCLIDQNKQILSNLPTILPSNVDCTIVHKDILDTELEPGSYNLAVLSHILYYIKPDYWFDIVKSIYKSLKINGILVIVMGGDELGKGELIKHFGGETLPIDQLASHCAAAFGANHVSLYSSQESFVASTKEAMFHISAFMLGDANITSSKEDLNQFIKKEFQVEENFFEMTTIQKYIVIRRNDYLKEYLHEIDTPSPTYQPKDQ